MRVATVVVLLALAVETDAKDSTQDLLDRLFDRVLHAPLNHTDVDDTTMGKPAQLSASPTMGKTVMPNAVRPVSPTITVRPYDYHAHPYGKPRMSNSLTSPAITGPMPAHRPGVKTQAAASLFKDVPTAPADSILKLAVLYREDPFPNKVNLGIGAYRTAEGKTWILPSVKAAEEAVCNDACADKEYQPIDGKPEYKRAVQELIFSPDIIDSGKLVTVQALSGTGSLSIVAQFLVEFIGVKKIYIPNPTWGNHPAVFNRAGIAEVQKYPYWKPETKGLDFDGMMAVLKDAQPGEVLLLHAVAHNPTGVDPTEAQWKEIVNVCKEKKLIPLIDNAYQGYASGNLAKDGLAQNLFAESGLEYFIAQSFAKNFGLYGERIGYIHVNTASKEVAPAVLSQLKILVRQAYSSPPRHGAAIVNKILSSPDLKKQWLSELELMSNRILEMRSALRKALEDKGTPGTWNHVTDQIGMFTFTGMSPPQVERMVNEFHIYMTGDGRISVAGLNPGNIEYVANAINKVVKDEK